MSTTRTRVTALALIGAAGLAAAAMTGIGVAASSDAKAAPTAVRPLSATGVALKFTPRTLRAPAGSVRLRLTNRSDLAHNVALRGAKLAKPRVGKVVGRGEVSKITVTLPPGRYTYYCSVFGHEAGGMKGTLVVAAPS